MLSDEVMFYVKTLLILQVYLFDSAPFYNFNEVLANRSHHFQLFCETIQFFSTKSLQGPIS